MVRRAIRRTTQRRRRSQPAGARIHARRRPIELHRETGLTWIAERVGATAIAVASATVGVALRTFDAPPDGSAEPGAPDRSEPASSGMRARLVERIHTAGVGAFPLIFAVAGGTGTAIIMQGTMAPQPPSPELGRLLVVVVLREIAPLFTALLVAGHAGPVVASDLTTRGGRDLRRARTCHVVGTAIATTVLCIHFAAVAMAAAFATSAAVTIRTYGAVRDGLLHEIALFDAPLVLGKAIVLGAIVGWLGLRAAEERAAGDAGGHSGSRLFVRSLLSASVVSVGVTVCLYAIIGAPPPP